MNTDDIVRYTTQALLISLLVSLPAVLSSALIGLLVAFVQAITSLQDASIGHGIKLLVVSLVITVTAPWSSAMLYTFCRTLWQAAFHT
jgi:type III secretion protein S